MQFYDVLSANNCISGNYAEAVWALWAQSGTISAEC